jgi:riboflavin kinase
LQRKLRLTGTVVSGCGEGKKFVNLSWFQNQVTEKLGFKPFPGTLNIKLSEDRIKSKGILAEAKPIEISPAANFYSGRCYRAYLNDYVECAVVIPEVPNYPENILEIIAPVNLRKKFQLKDGDRIKVEIVFST